MITNGVVSIEDGNKGEPNDFNPRRKVKVEIGFSVDEGEDGNNQALLAGQVADAHVKRLLGREVTATEVAASKPVSKPKKPARNDKAALEAAAGLTAGGVVETSIVDNTKVVDLVVEKNAPAYAAEPEADSLDDLLGEQAPVPITDAELAKAAQNKNGQMKAKDPNFSVKIRALVVEYAGQPPKKITDVPVAKRQEFLDKLRDLT